MAGICGIGSIDSTLFEWRSNLDLTMDYFLSWTSHVAQVSPKLLYTLGRRGDERCERRLVSDVTLPPRSLATCRDPRAGKSIFSHSTHLRFDEIPASIGRNISTDARCLYTYTGRWPSDGTCVRNVSCECSVYCQLRTKRLVTTSTISA